MNLDQLLESISGLISTPRDAAVLAEPDLHIRWPLADVAVVDKAGRQRGTLRVASDVFAIGTPDAPIRVPLTGPGAQALADRMGMHLPTTRIASLVCASGQVALKPESMTPPRYPYVGMCGTDRFLIHNQWIEERRAGRTGLVVGHKKDVVTTNRLAAQPKQVAIFGWFRRPGDPIQSLSLIHEAEYADYSHGIRLVAPTMILDGEERLVADALCDPLTAALLSDEGVLDLSLRRYRPFPSIVVTPPGPPVGVATGPRRSLEVGCTGAEVRAWQEQLTALGFSPGRIDGDFGQRTDKATRAFQAKAGIRVDGQVGQKTREAAARAMAALSANSSGVAGGVSTSMSPI